MTCTEFQNHLSAYADGELSRWTRWKVENHLSRCRECASLLSDLRAVDDCLLLTLDAVPAPEYLAPAVMRRLPAMPPAWKPRPGGVRWAIGLAVAAVQVLAIYGAYWWGFVRGSTTAANPGPAAAVRRADPGGGTPPPTLFGRPQPAAAGSEAFPFPAERPAYHPGNRPSAPIPRPGSAVAAPALP